MKALNITVQGRVQGVFFRASTRDKAHELGIKGWCKNQSDGSVFIRAEGEADALATFASWCHQGPMMARVIKVVTEEIISEGFSAFEIRH